MSENSELSIVCDIFWTCIINTVGEEKIVVCYKMALCDALIQALEFVGKINALIVEYVVGFTDQFY